ncbi:MAG: hypothetical protein H0U27_07050 [Nitrosopumilus sp.]|nr:hypothetical protein [Nitrosopumilus sp.]
MNEIFKLPLDNSEVNLFFTDYGKMAYKAKNENDEVSLTRALEGMYRVGSTEEEMLKIIDYITVPGCEFEKMVLRKRDDIKNNKTSDSESLAA